jgi:hypothetical protein
MPTFFPAVHRWPFLSTASDVIRVELRRRAFAAPGRVEHV